MPDSGTCRWGAEGRKKLETSWLLFLLCGSLHRNKQIKLRGRAKQKTVTPALFCLFSITKPTICALVKEVVYLTPKSLFGFQLCVAVSSQKYFKCCFMEPKWLCGELWLDSHCIYLWHLIKLNSLLGTHNIFANQDNKITKSNVKGLFHMHAEKTYLLTFSVSQDVLGGKLFVQSSCLWFCRLLL